MDRNAFWALIEIAKAQDDTNGALEAELHKLEADEIISYQEHFDDLFHSAYQWNLWGAAYIIEGGCSDDGFTDFRYGLISLGENIYESAVSDPDTLSTLDPSLKIENELFGYIALKVYESKFGAEIPKSKSISPVDPTGEEWDFDDKTMNQTKLPNLMNIHW